MKKRTIFLPIIMAILLSYFFAGSCLLTVSGDEQISIVSEPKYNATADVPYIYQLVIDGNKDKVGFQLIDAPEGMTVGSVTGVIKWTPAQEQIGDHKVNIQISDSLSKDEQVFTITVNALQLSSIIVKPDSMNLEGINTTKKIEFINALYKNVENFSRLIDKTRCVFTSSNENIATVNKEGVVEARNIGTTEILVSYTEDDITKSVSIPVVITFPPLPVFGGGWPAKK